MSYIPYLKAPAPENPQLSDYFTDSWSQILETFLWAVMTFQQQKLLVSGA